MKKGWQTRRLGEVCEFLKRGISPKYLETGGICVLNQKCIRNHSISFDLSRRHDISTKNVRDEQFIQIGDVLVNSTGTGTLGRVAQVRELPPEPTTVDSHVTIARPKKNLFHLDFFGYMMILIEDEIKEAGEGCGGQTELARSTLANKFLVSFPEDFTEQRKIVELLDESFKSIDTIKVNTEKNLHNARELFESHLNSCLLQKNKNWPTKSLQEVCTIKPQKSAVKKQLSDSDMVSFVPMENLEVNQKFFSHSQIRRMSEVVKSYTYFADNDVLLAKITPCFENGKLGIAKNLVNGIGFGSSEFIVFRPCPCLVNEWLYHVLSRESFRIEGAKHMTGAVGHKRISKEYIENYQISIPSIDEQLQIIKLLDTVSTKISQLISTYQKKLTALGELKQSLLHQAFRGRL